jgi:hypothetical protein
MPSQFLKQFADRSVIRNWVWHRYNTLEPKHTIFVTPYDRTAVCFIAPILILHVVFAMGVCLPHIYLDVWHRFAGCGLDSTEDE